jgi:ABC-type nickel/cobalt efflux system permease component RcnA
VVLLSAIAFHRIVFGMLLIIAFSLGLATTLTSIGMLVVYSQRVVATLRPLRRDQRLPHLLGGLARILPAASALVVAALGSVIAIGALGPGLLPALLVHL